MTGAASPLRRAGARAGRWARPLFVVAAVALAVVALVGDGHAAAHRASDIGAPRLLLATVAALAGLYASALAWRALLAGLGARLAVRPALDVFFVGQLGKYLPGSVFAVVGQVQRAGAAGVSRTAVAATAVLTMVMNVASGALVAAGLLPFADAGALGHHPELLVALPVALAVLHPRVLGPLLDRGLRLVRRPPLPAPPAGRAILVALAWSLVVWACYGAHIWALAGGLGAHGGRLPLLATGGYALAWTAGFLFVVAPAGIGVREAALVLALRPVLGAPAALAVGVVSRLLMTLADLVWAAVGALVGGGQKAQRGRAAV